MSLAHNHAHVAGSERALWRALGLAGSFPVVNGSEAAHIRTDNAALVIALAATSFSCAGSLVVELRQA